MPLIVYRNSPHYRALRFLKLFSENNMALQRYYGCYRNYQNWFKSVIPDLVKLAKRLSKVEHIDDSNNKKSKRCWHVCCRIMSDVKTACCEELDRNKLFVFQEIVKQLYAFNREMSILLCYIVSDILQDKRLNYLTERSPQLEESKLRVFFGVFFGKVKVSLFPPKNLSFYLSMFSAQCICARSNPRKRLLTTSGFIQILVQKLRIPLIFGRIHPKHFGNLLFK
jgi:hypothetical protein